LPTPIQDDRTGRLPSRPVNRPIAFYRFLPLLFDHLPTIPREEGFNPVGFDRHGPVLFGELDNELAGSLWGFGFDRYGFGRHIAYADYRRTLYRRTLAVEAALAKKTQANDNSLTISQVAPIITATEDPSYRGCRKKQEN
jgi:hypothetical protein